MNADCVVVVSELDERPTETLAMLAHQRVRLDNCHRLEDRREPSIKLQEEQPIAIRELDKTAQLSLQDAQLLPERRISAVVPVMCRGWTAATKPIDQPIDLAA
jgi:hypothetical protein